MRVLLCEDTFEKNEWMRAVPMAKANVAVRKSSPTRTAVFLVDVVTGGPVGMVGAVAEDLAVPSAVGWSSVAVVMVAP